MPLEIFRQGALEGVELEKGASAPKWLNSNISKTKFKLYLEILVLLECIVFLRLKRSVENRWSEKKLRSPEAIFDLAGPDPQTVTDSPLCVTPFCRGSRAL